ncbi:hypothetical protein DFS33DRAFT_1123352 [Desarmillaria ectypa]|nr:hypothetical protein DFS33DRAFT_1123352 [Desarmillaria ectypa]
MRSKMHLARYHPTVRQPQLPIPSPFMSLLSPVSTTVTIVLGHFRKFKSMLNSLSIPDDDPIRIYLQISPIPFFTWLTSFRFRGTRSDMNRVPFMIRLERIIILLQRFVATHTARITSLSPCLSIFASPWLCYTTDGSAEGECE